MKFVPTKNLPAGNMMEDSDVAEMEEDQWNSSKGEKAQKVMHGISVASCK